MSSPGLREKPIVGYSDPLSVAPGEPIRFMVSTADPSFDASVVRLRHGDPAPDGPGLRYEDVPSAIDGTYPGVDQPLRLGSYVAVAHDDALEPAEGLTLQAWIYPTAPGRGLQGLVTKWSEPLAAGYGLFLEPGGDVSLRIDGAVHRCEVALRPFEWAFACASWDAATGAVTVEQRPLSRTPDDPAAVRRTVAGAPGPSPSAAELVLGGHVGADGPVGRCNGKLDSPRLFGRALAAAELAALAAGAPPADLPALLADWDLAADPDGERLLDASGNAHHGRVVNHPTRGVTGHAWDGRETAFARCPEQYRAIHFHDDDLEDAGWTPAVTYVPPAGLRSGVYALRATTATAEDWIPFFVRPATGGATAPIAFLAPTLSYLAYANEHSAAEVHEENAAFDITAHYQPEDRYAIAEPVTGLYDRHPDGTGVCYSSWLRPIVSMRPHYRLPVARSAHQLSADLHVIDWLEQKAFAHDVVTDHDLHRDGAALLEPYRVLVTGTHPEYWTADMLDALEHWLDRGGRLMYLGGNGFYWVTSVSPSRPHVIEVRRGRRGTGSWRSAPGEDHHSTTGELGGLWRDRGRAPQQLAGVGMAAQGFDRGRPYRREPGSYGDDVAWIFDRVEGDDFGDAGLVLGAAAGFEMDRMDHALGTPRNATLLATARGFSDAYQHVVEEVETSDSRQGGTVSPYVRADMVYAELAGGGAVFSTGSIAWGGALSADGYDGDVSRITENVLRRFADGASPTTSAARGGAPGEVV